VRLTAWAEVTKLAEHFRSRAISVNDIVDRFLERQPGIDRVLIVVTAWWRFTERNLRCNRGTPGRRGHESRRTFQRALFGRAENPSARFAKADAEAQKREAIAARDKLEAKNRELRSLLEEAAQSDWLVAKEKLIAGEAPAALAHLARAISYEPISTLAPETAVAALNDWRFPLPLATLRGHEGALFGAQFSPNGERIVTASSDNTARLWDTDTGKLLATLQGHEGPVYNAQFSPRWEADRNCLLRQNRTALGHRNRKAAGHSSGPSEHRDQRAVQPRWEAHRDRLRRQDRAALGHRQRQVAGHSPGP
jgi:hypothetical protein